MSTNKQSCRFTVENDLADKSAAQVEEERRVMAERVERGRRRLTMNRTFLRKSTKKSKKRPNKT
jgi:hypothetical protein